MADRDERKRDPKKYRKSRDWKASQPSLFGESDIGFRGFHGRDIDAYTWVARAFCQMAALAQRRAGHYKPLRTGNMT